MARIQPSQGWGAGSIPAGPTDYPPFKLNQMKTRELLFVSLFPLTIFIAVFFLGFKINYMESLLLIFGVPSLYLSFKNKNKIKKVAYFAFLVSVPVAITFEFVAFGDNSWRVPSSILPKRLFGIMPLEDYIWMFLTVYTILVFYEHFCNEKFQKKISGRIRMMNYALFPLALMIILIFLINPSVLKIPYSFLWLGLAFFLIPVAVFLVKFPYLASNFFKTQAFFSYIHMIFELIGLRLSHWVYPGVHYVGWVPLLGLRFPIEELFFVMVLGGFAACTYYEFFTNDKLTA